MIKSTYIKNILDLLLDGDEKGNLFRPQLEVIIDDKYNYTSGNGLFITFKPNGAIESLRQDNMELTIDGVTITSKNKSVEAQAILFIKNGFIDYLEIWCVTGNYPDSDLMHYTIKQDWIGSLGRQIIVD